MKFWLRSLIPCSTRLFALFAHVATFQRPPLCASLNQTRVREWKTRLDLQRVPEASSLILWVSPVQLQWTNTLKASRVYLLWECVHACKGYMTPRHLGQLVMMFAQRSQSWWAQGLGLHGFDDLQDEREQPLQDKWADGVGDLQKLARPLPQFLQYPRWLSLPPMIFREQKLSSKKPPELKYRHECLSHTAYGKKLQWCLLQTLEPPRASDLSEHSNYPHVRFRASVT